MQADGEILKISTRMLDEAGYIELNSKANRLAHWLAAHGLKSDEVVAVHFDRSIELAVAKRVSQ